MRARLLALSCFVLPFGLAVALAGGQKAPSGASAAVAAAPAPAPAAALAPAAGELANVAAFARLYGVVRYFYPSDDAAALDWNRFAVLGVSRVRPAADTRALAQALQRLYAPLGPGIEIGAELPPAAAVAPAAGPLVAWRYLGPGFVGSGPYKARRTNRAAAPAGGDGFVTLMQSLPGEGLRGQTLRLRAQVRAEAPAGQGGGALWLRVDRANGQAGFFDNMGDRPVRDGSWRSYAVEGPVAEDAVGIAFGVMTVGAVTADFDAVEVHAKDAAGDWRPLVIRDPGFEADADGRGAWYQTGSGTASITRPGAGAPEGARYVRFAPAAPKDELPFTEGEPLPGAHVDLDLAPGLRARVPLALGEPQAGNDPARSAVLSELQADLAAVAGPAAAPEADQRLADVVVAWGTLRHFYPYWKEAGVDWDARLVPQLAVARAAGSRAEQLDALRGLVSDLRDGHGRVLDTLEKAKPASLPIELAVVEGRLTIVASDVPGEAPVGAVVTTIDGVAAGERLARALALVSGTPQWRRANAAWRLRSGKEGAPVRLGLEDGAGRRDVVLACRSAPAPSLRRPEPVAELEPGLWYVDLTRVTMAKLAPKLDTLAAARALVFDVRGYPTDAGAGLLPHLLAAAESDRWMHVAKIVGPFGAEAGSLDIGWNVRPESPRIAGRVAFLTDGGAISYAESVMGYVADHKLGTIVGQATAGTNGNVASVATPGGFTIHFTGMRVTRHDGRSPHHLVGVQPDVPAEPTLAGVRAGRDEVLEKALAVLRGVSVALSRGPR